LTNKTTAAARPEAAARRTGNRAGGCLSRDVLAIVSMAFFFREGVAGWRDGG
jgi:hypothetical protein